MAPLTVAIAVVRRNDDLLLINRNRGDYVGLWALPGGKVEMGEHIHHAAEREVAEETNVVATFRQHLGVVSEHLIENGGVTEQFELHVCELLPDDSEIEAGSEGAVRWASLEGIGEPMELVPSDRTIIDRMVAGGDRGYCECVIEKRNGMHTLREFTTY